MHVITNLPPGALTFVIGVDAEQVLHLRSVAHVKDTLLMATPNEVRLTALVERKGVDEGYVNRVLHEKCGVLFIGGRASLERWPANVLLSHDCTDKCDSCPLARVDRQSGIRRSGSPGGALRKATGTVFRGGGNEIPLTGYGDEGGASRFFQTVQASDLTHRFEVLLGLAPVVDAVTFDFRDVSPPARTETPFEVMQGLPQEP